MEIFFGLLFLIGGLVYERHQERKAERYAQEKAWQRWARQQGGCNQ